MRMSRYIDAVIAAEKVSEKHNIPLSELVDTFAEMPSADVVEVVRCKDCKEYNTYSCAEGFGWCEAFGLGKTDDQFCSYGERADMRGDKR